LKYIECILYTRLLLIIPRKVIMESTCESCKGKGYIPRLDIMKATTVKEPCKACKGAGKIIESVKDGVVFFTQNCQVGYWQELKNSKPIATLHLHICPVIDRATGRPLSKKRFPENPLSKEMVPRIFLEVIQMNTRSKYQRQGIMAKLLKNAMADSKIEWVESSWDDSTGAGRNFLISQGFTQEGSKIVYRKKIEE
jgi:hypothetical protein